MKHVIENLFLLFEFIVSEQVVTQDMLAREHVGTQGTLAREHVSMQDMLAREQARKARWHVNM